MQDTTKDAFDVHVCKLIERDQKNWCRRKTRALVRRGILTKQPCACGSTDVQAHHENYNDPYTVTWMCKWCHDHKHVTERVNDWDLTPEQRWESAKTLMVREGMATPEELKPFKSACEYEKHVMEQLRNRSQP